MVSYVSLALVCGMAQTIKSRRRESSKALVTLHVDAVSRETPAGALNADEMRVLGERMIRFYGFDFRLLVEQAIHDLVRRRRQGS